MNPYFTDYSEYLKRFFGDTKVQKISVNAGNTCPNRDGRIGTGGCIYCNNASFTPSYCMGNKDIIIQIEEGKTFFKRKYKEMKFLVYFQSYTNTYNTSSGELKNIYEKVLGLPDVVGLTIGTRPDCLDEETIAMLAHLNQKHPIFVELGIETMRDDTLKLINRGHSSSQSENAIKRLKASNLQVGVHLIAGLPGEDEPIIMDSIKKVCLLGADSIKLHHLQILKNTRLSELVATGEMEIKVWDLDEYVEFCKRVVKIIPKTVAIERFLASAPPEMVEQPKWGIKNYEFTNLLINKLKEK